jgi:predicted AlkP superfamily pyrophosphatase or phosphodiesterase
MTRVERAILIVIDGLRPDALQLGHTPNMDALIENGACSFQAQTIMPSITLPTHMSMFYSVPSDRHGVITNTYQPSTEPIIGLMELAHQHKLLTSAIYSWEPLRDLWRHNHVDLGYFLNLYSSATRDFDYEIARAAADLIPSERLELSFVYLGMVDEIAHKVGWMSAEYMQAVQRADAAVGLLVERLRDENLLASTVILIQADHGGHEHRHGEDIPEDMTIPWILVGPGVQRGCRLTGPVSILDTAPTLAHLLRLPIPPEWQGQVVFEALLQDE